jgi:hypothetical protein
LTAGRPPEPTATAAARAAGLDERGRYGIVLALLVASVVVTIAAQGAGWAQVLTPALQGACVVLVLGGRAGDWRVRAGVVALVVCAVAGGVLVSGPIGRGTVALLDAAIVASLPVIIVVRLRRRLYVSVQTVLGAVSIYLVIGMVFSGIDSAMSALGGASFFTSTGQKTASDYTYFSFITLSTVGYGDLVPAGGLPRAAAVAEALLGQLYLVTIVALLVSNVGRARSPADDRART